MLIAHSQFIFYYCNICDSFTIVSSGRLLKYMNYGMMIYLLLCR